MTDSLGALIAGKYRIQRPLAQGGMGAIFVAEHVQLGTRVAIKRLTRELDDGHVSRFRREAIAAAQLKSQHIVHVFDFGEDDVGPYIVMELLEGEDLATLLEREHVLSIQSALRIIGQVAAALSFAHRAGIVHRDIKPRNIFLARDPTAREPVVKVLDFGIAKDLLSDGDASFVTAPQSILGSPGYMSPEQVRGRDVDKTTDVWALTVVLYELIVGRSPFATEHMGDTLARICEGRYVAATTLRPELAPAWNEVFARGLALTPEGRYSDVLELLDAAHRVAGTESSASSRSLVPPPSFTSQDTRTLSVAETADSSKNIDVTTHDVITKTAEALPLRTSPLRSLTFAVIIVGALGALSLWLLGARKNDVHGAGRPSLEAPSPERNPPPAAEPAPEPAQSVAAPLAEPAPPSRSAEPPPHSTKETRKKRTESPPKPTEKGAAEPAPAARRDPFTGIVEPP